MVTKMMYGAQSDKFDYHMIGFDEPILNYFLTKDGLYCEVQRVGSFNLFNDTRQDPCKNLSPCYPVTSESLLSCSCP